MVEAETASMSTLMPTLPARPPTPPRESSHHESKPGILDRFFSRKKPISRRTSSISTISPDSSAESPNASVGSIRKKVEWADLTDYNDPPSTSVDGKEIFHQAFQPLPPSSERKPTKSILKAKVHHALEHDHNSQGGMNTKLLPPHHHATFATMLESITQQLAGTDRSSKMDAYLMLSASLKASDNVPDVKALRDKMELLLSLIKRDLTEKTDAGKLDSSLIINALILLSSFLHKPVIAEAITPEFAIYIVDHAIRTFEDGQMSKDIVKHLMFILAQQNFSPKIMNQERLGRLITALHNIESNNLKGKSIVIGRINIYRTLLRQSRTHMLAHQDWIEDLFTDMLSSLKEIRSQAITFGLEAAFSLGLESKVSRAVSNLFQLEVKDQGKYADVYVGRLKEMIKNKQDTTAPSAVPQIWSVVILFLRGRSRQLEQWAFMAIFVEVIQGCFNCSDTAAKREALYAWNRFIFAVQPDEKTTPTLIKLLSQPLARQIKRANLRSPTLSTLYCLLYYSLKPTSSHTQLDLYWNEYVVPLVGKCLTPVDVRGKPELAKQALGEVCLVLQSLFDSTTPRIWSETRAMDNLPQNNFDVKELPALDAKWLRKSALRVFPVLDPLLEKLYWGIGDKSDILLLWQTYVKSIASPAVMEVKVSNDTMASVASIFGLLYRIWHAGPNNPGIVPHSNDGQAHSVAFLKSFENLTITLLNGLGPLPFTERQLCIGTQDTFIPIATPSQRPGKLRGQVKTPLHHLVTLLATVSPSLEYDNNYVRVVHRILLTFFDARKTRKSRIELAKSLSEILPSESTDPCRIIWQVLANFATTAIDTRDGESSGNNDQPLGAGYRDVVKILEVGVKLAPHDPLPGWKILFEAVVNSATLDAGDAGRAIAVIEPLAKSCLSNSSKARTPFGVFHFHLLVGKASYPRDRQALDAANKRLWGTVTAGQKGTTFDPYVHLYEFIQISLETSYASFDKHTLHNCSDIISTTSSLLTRCPSLLRMGVLSRLQSGIGPWISDCEGKLSGGNTLSVAIIALWNTICDLVSRLQDTHSHTKILSELEALICAGLESKHKMTVNTTIKLWNSTFGISDQLLEYPEHLKNTLVRLRSIADIQLPSFPTSLETEDPVDQRQPMGFAESQYDPGNSFNSSGLNSVPRVHRFEPHLESSPMRRLRQTTPQVIIGSLRQSLKRSRDATPESSQRKSRKREITPRLRHDDSQIQFQAIDSSPIVDKVVGSQLLTVRQKEVKERQQADAAMFPDLRSSPRSKGKSAQGTEAPDPDLPTHRSSSNLRTDPNTERQTTPTLVTPSDDDHFVTSSPTPTRSIREEVDLDAVSSSPPESARKKDEIEYGEDVPSSPPEQVEALETDFTTSIDPSAQLDPCAVENDLVASTYGSTIDLSGIFTAPDVLNPHPAEANVGVEVLASSKPQPQLAEPELRLYDHVEEVEEPSIQPPETPTSKRQGSPVAQCTPITPQEAFVDARASPTSSDRNIADDEVFEDAVSSPRLNIEKTRAKEASSPLSDLDESSMMRVMAEFDDQTGQSSRQVSFADDKENQPRRTRASSVKDSPQLPHSNATPMSKSKTSLRKTSLLRHEQTAADDKGAMINEKALPTSSIPSLIPETPAAGTTSASEKLIVDGEEFDPEDTIMVDDSILCDEDYTQTVSRRRKRQHITTHPHKRKHEEATEDHNEVPDSQELTVDAPAPSPRKPATKKKRPGKNSLQPSQDIDIDTSMDLRRSQSASVDVDAPMPDTVDDSTTDALTSIANEPTEEINMQEDEKRAPSAEEGLEIAQTAEEIAEDKVREDGVAINAQFQDGTTSFGFEVIADNTVDENNLLESPSPDPVRPESNPSAEDVLETAPEVIEAPLAPTSNVEPGISSPAAAEPEIPTMYRMREKLQGLITDLHTASLTREEVNELEDMFMDAKGLLYGAGRRGRQSVDM